MCRLLMPSQSRKLCIARHSDATASQPWGWPIQMTGVPLLFLFLHLAATSNSPDESRPCSLRFRYVSDSATWHQSLLPSTFRHFPRNKREETTERFGSIYFSSFSLSLLKARNEDKGLLLHVGRYLRFDRTKVSSRPGGRRLNEDPLSSAIAVAQQAL